MPEEIQPHDAYFADKNPPSSAMSQGPAPDPERARMGSEGPRLPGTCSRCGGPMDENVNGTTYHKGPSCHWHAEGSGCCEFIPAE